MALLEVNNLNKAFGKTAVLKNVSLSLTKGKCLAIIGSSGSGKTTLLRCLNFLETPDEGTIYLDGELLYDAAKQKDYSENDVRKMRMNFGLVFQNFNLFRQYTALQNVTLAPLLAAKADKASKEELDAIREKGAALLKRVGLENKTENYPHQLSGGQQQRVAIARALALEPAILCFDEPTSALDPELTGEVLKVIRALREQDTTMIIVTHEIRFARDIADYVIFMDDGAIVEEGPPEQVIDAPTNPRTVRFLERYAEM